MSSAITSIQQLKPWSRNPREIDKKSFEGLKVSVDEFGDLSGIVFNVRLDALVCGHQRLQALQDKYGDQLKIEDNAILIPTGESFRIRIVDWDEVKHAAANVVANSPNITGDFTSELGKLLDELHVSMPDISRDLRLDDLRAEFKQLWEQESKEDDAPLAPQEPRSKTGDLYELGPHRLICGDCTDGETIDRLMQGEKAQLVFTDPPYNVNYRSASGRSYHSQDFGGDGTKILNDDKSDEECLRFYWNALNELHRATTDDAVIYWWFASRNQHLNRQAFLDSGWHLSQVVIWLKNSFILSMGQEFHRCYEPCIVGWKEGQKHYTNKAIATLSDVFSLDYIDFQEQFDVWYERRDLTSRYVHPTQKPVRLAERAMKKSSRMNDLVLDFFGGSGSTLISGIQLKRRVYLVELDPKFCDVIVTRYCKFIGSNKVRLNGNEIEWGM